MQVAAAFGHGERTGAVDRLGREDSYIFALGKSVINLEIGYMNKVKFPVRT